MEIITPSHFLCVTTTEQFSMLNRLYTPSTGVLQKVFRKMKLKEKFISVQKKKSFEIHVFFALPYFPRNFLKSPVVIRTCQHHTAFLGLWAIPPLTGNRLLYSHYATDSVCAWGLGSAMGDFPRMGSSIASSLSVRVFQCHLHLSQEFRPHAP